MRLHHHLSLLATVSLASLSAMAQVTPGVQVYGRVDLGLRHDTARDASGSKIGTQVATATNNGLGLMGTEDLGSGNSAFFRIEHRFNADTGAVVDNSAFWSEIAVVGLQGRYGTLQLGRQDGPIYYGLSPDAFYGDYVGGRGERKAGADDKFNNGALYISPAWNGVQLYLGGTADRVVASNGQVLDHAKAAALKYQQGPLMLSAAVAKRFNGDTAWGGGASYDTSVATLLFVAGRNDGKGYAGLSDGIRTTLDIGAIVPIGQGSFRVKFNHDKRETATTRNVGLGYLYDLSKRTNLYLTGSNTRVTGQSATNAFDLGIVHRF